MLYFKKIIKFIFVVLIFLALTILTQIGGIAFLLGLFLSNLISLKFRFKTVIVCVGVYLIFTFILTPIIAPFLGREPIKHTKIIKPTNYFTVFLNRNYVSPNINEVLENIEFNIKYTNVSINYLDANFPFINGFPLLPHLSHNDGKKLDLSLIYETNDGNISSKQKSISGYGVFENPRQNEFNQIDKCKVLGYFQYDYPKYLTFGTINNNLVFSEKGNKQLISAILKNKSIEKLFIEPHLKQRLKLTDKRVRYHGCKAVRHDDHIHIQIQ